MTTSTPFNGSAEDALVASIERFGVVLPIAVDDTTGLVVEGHRRKEIADERGISYKTVYVSEKPTWQLDAMQRRALASGLREEGHSARAIAIALGVHHATVLRDIEQALGVQPERILGLDNKFYPGKRPTKRCSTCGLDKPLTSFGRDRTHADGHNWECRPCTNARIVAKPPVDPTRTRAAVSERLEKIRTLAGKGWHASQIANEIQRSVSWVRAQAKKHDIDIRADRLLSKQHATDWNRVMAQVSMDADTIAEGTAGLNFESLDGDLIPEWIESIERALADLQALRRKLRAERTRREQ